MTFWRCYYHFIWATKVREPVIDQKIEKVIFEIIRAKSSELDCHVLAINGTQDHIHVAVNIPPKVSVAEWAKAAKGVSAREINLSYPDRESRFSWQSGYGVLTFGAKHIDLVVGYIERQKEHHRMNTLIAYLEQDSE